MEYVNTMNATKHCNLHSNSSNSEAVVCRDNEHQYNGETGFMTKTVYAMVIVVVLLCILVLIGSILLFCNPTWIHTFSLLGGSSLKLPFLFATKESDAVTQTKKVGNLRVDVKFK